MLQLEKINAYYGESHILRDVSFTIDSGEVVCLMGRNGVGKTTTLKVLTGLLPARSGRMMFDGADVTKEATDGRARRGLAYVPQGREILPHLTVRENLLLGFWARSDKPNGTVEKTVFDEVYHLFPKLTTNSQSAWRCPERRRAAAVGDRPRDLVESQAALTR